MKLKDLKTDTKNLFDEIDFFKGLEDTNSYYQEFIYLYGERDLINKVELIFNDNGLIGVGDLFTLKTDKWIDLKLIGDKIKDLENADRTVINTGTKVNKGDRTRKTNTNDTNQVTPFDVKESIENEQNNNTIDEVENSTDDLTTENKSIYTGFSRDKINYFLNRFKSYTEYRRLIYNDIVNMLTLQLY